MWGVVRQHVAGRSAPAPALGAAGPGLGSGPADGHHSPGLQPGLHPAGKPEPCTLRCARARVRRVQGLVKQDRFLHQDLGVVKPGRNHSVLFQSALICSQLSLCFLVFTSVTFAFVPFFCAPAQICRHPAAAQMSAQQRAPAVG